MTSDSQALAFSSSPAAIADRRAALFRESAAEQLERWALGAAWALKPHRMSSLPYLTWLLLQDALLGEHDLPDPERIVDPRSGACGVVHSLLPDTLMAAYRGGMYPFAHVGPIKWLSPAERCVLSFDQFRISKNARRAMRQGRYKVTFDRDFEGVIKACAGRRSGKWHLTWITPRIMRAYAALFDAGHAHSFEVWNERGELVGGGYGVAAGRVFSTESQFSLERDTSKIGFTVLNWHLAKWGFALNDGKGSTPTLMDMGFRLIPRAEFRAQLRDPALPGTIGRWRVEDTPETVAAWQPK